MGRVVKMQKNTPRRSSRAATVKAMEAMSKRGSLSPKKGVVRNKRGSNQFQLRKRRRLNFLRPQVVDKVASKSTTEGTSKQPR